MKVLYNTTSQIVNLLVLPCKHKKLKFVLERQKIPYEVELSFSSRLTGEYLSSKKTAGEWVGVTGISVKTIVTESSL